MNKKLKGILFPTGTFTNKEFTVTFTDDRKYLFKDQDRILVEGSYIISGDKIVLTDESGIVACTEPDTSTGQYQWEFDEKQLIMNKIEDLCEGRISNLTEKPWIPLE
jgi:hypothetical protein